MTVVLGACSKTDEVTPVKKMADVGFIIITPERLPISTTLQGRTTAYLTADIRPQISGIIKSRLFKEGAYVKQGEVLYQIEAMTYQAAVESANAALSKAKATLSASQVKAERYAQLLDIDAVSKQDNDDMQNALNENRASVDVAHAALKTARINLDYTKIKSPISGRIETSTATPGALVVAQQAAALTTVQKINPIYVDVTQSSVEVLRLRKEFLSGGIEKIGTDTAAVDITLEDGTLYPLQGRLTFSGLSVNPNTGMITLRAEVPNPEGILLPGMVVKATIEEGSDDHAILVPQRAVTHDALGNPTTLIMDSDNKVQRRTLTTVRAAGNRWVISDGLQPGDKVIVNGLQNVNVGDKANGINMRNTLGQKSPGADKSTAASAAETANAANAANATSAVSAAI